MSNEIYNCAKCLKDYNSNQYPPVVIDEERYCEDCACEEEALRWCGEFDEDCEN